MNTVETEHLLLTSCQISCVTWQDFSWMPHRVTYKRVALSIFTLGKQLKPFKPSYRLSALSSSTCSCFLLWCGRAAVTVQVLAMPACRDHGGRKQEYRRSWSNNSGLVNTEMFQIVIEYEILMYVTHMPVLNQFVSVTEERNVCLYCFLSWTCSLYCCLAFFRIYIT